MSKKVKGQKVDLASFIGSSSATDNIVLPSAPNPNRDPNEGRRRRDFNGEAGTSGGSRYSARSDDFGRSEDSGSGWSRGEMGGGRGNSEKGFSGRGSDRMVGERGFGDRERGFGDRERGFGDRERGFGGENRGERVERGDRATGFGPEQSEDEPWRRGSQNKQYADNGPKRGVDNSRSFADVGPRRGGDFGSSRQDDRERDGFGGGDSAWRGSRSSSTHLSGPPLGERPRLKLEPRTAPLPESGQRPVSSVVAAVAEDPNDKWSNVFKKKTSTTDVSQDNGSRGTSSFSRDEGYGGASRGYPDRLDRSRMDSYGSASQNDKLSSSDTQSLPIPPRVVKVNADTDSTAKPEAAKPAKEDPKVAAKAAKAAERAAREEADRIARLEKEAQAEREKTARQEASQAASAAVETSLKGSDLLQFVEKLEVKPTGAALLTEVLSKLAEPTSLKWCSPDEYGIVLKALVTGSARLQADVLFVIQGHCHRFKFPKIEVKGSSRNLIEVTFQLLFKNEIIEDVGFLEWADDENDSVPGRLNAVVQTTAFVTLLREADDDDDYDEEDDEVDAPQQVIA